MKKTYTVLFSCSFSIHVFAQMCVHILVSLSRRINVFPEHLSFKLITPPIYLPTFTTLCEQWKPLLPLCDISAKIQHEPLTLKHTSAVYVLTATNLLNFRIQTRALEIYISNQESLHCSPVSCSPNLTPLITITTSVLSLVMAMHAQTVQSFDLKAKSSLYRLIVSC